MWFSKTPAQSQWAPFQMGLHSVATEGGRVMVKLVSLMKAACSSKRRGSHGATMQHCFEHWDESDQSSEHSCLHTSISLTLLTCILSLVPMQSTRQLRRRASCVHNTVLFFILAVSFRAEDEVRTVRNWSKPGSTKRCSYCRGLGAEIPIKVTSILLLMLPNFPFNTRTFLLKLVFMSLAT